LELDPEKRISLEVSIETFRDDDNEEEEKKENFLEGINNLKKDDAKLMKSIAKDLFDFQEYKKALKAINKSLQIDSSDSLSFAIKGEILLALNNFEEALSAFQAGLKVSYGWSYGWGYRHNPCSDGINTLKGIFFKKVQAFYLEGKFQDALNETNFLIKTSPEDEQIYLRSLIK